jgi:beta-glucosidase
MGPAATSTIQCTVTNTGSRAGDEVVQLYIRDVLASVARPVIELKRFERVHLAPGEKRTLIFTIGPDDLRMLDKNMKWIVEPGTFRILIGASSKDLRLRGDLVVK